MMSFWCPPLSTLLADLSRVTVQNIYMQGDTRVKGAPGLPISKMKYIPFLAVKDNSMVLSLHNDPLKIVI